MTFSVFAPPPQGAAGFKVVAGREQGLRGFMVVAGRLPKGDVGPMHTHDGDEVLRVVSGQILVRCGEDRLVCSAGDLVIVPPDVLHGFRVLSDTVLEVVAEYDIGTRYPVPGPDGDVRLVEVHRQDMPWGRPPPPGRPWTDDQELDQILRQVREYVDPPE